MIGRRLVLSAAAVAALLVGCDTAPKAGEVTSKEHHNAWSSVVSTLCGKVACTIPVTHPERWELCLRDGDAEGCRSVGRDEYDRYQVGDRYP